MNDEQGYNLCKCTPCVLIHIMLSYCSLEHPICVEKPNASMTVKNGINQIGILVGGASAPRISKVIHAITEEAARRHKLAINERRFQAPNGGESGWYAADSGSSWIYLSGRRLHAAHLPSKPNKIACS